MLVHRQGHGVAAKAFLTDKRLGGVDQFAQVLQPVLAFFFQPVMLQQPAVLQHQLDDFAQGQAAGLLAQHLQLGDKSA